MPTEESSSIATHEEISRRARELWESRGQPSGQDETIWLEAERELRGRSNPSQPAATASTSTQISAPASNPSALPPSGKSGKNQRR